MTRTLLKLALGASLATLAISPPDASAGRGGGYGGGYGGSRGGYGGGSRGSYGGGGSYGGSHSGSGYGGSSGYGNRSSGGSSSNAGAAAAGAGYSNRNQPQHPNAAPAAAGAGYANRNQPQHPNAAPAAAGAGYANRNQPQHPNAAPAAAGAGYANNHNQSQYPNAAPAAAGAGYANNHNQSQYPNAGAAAAGAGYANNHNQNAYPYGAAAAGAGYWNGNNGMSGAGGVGAWGGGSPMYGYGYSGYSNPYAMGGMGGAGLGAAGVGQPAVAQDQPAAAAPSYNYSQPLNTAATLPEPSVADQASSTLDQARQAFKGNDYPTALQLDQQALGQTPNDPTMHEFLALTLFAQGKYEQAASPLYAVLSVGPGWNWTTLIGNYADSSTYIEQLRGLEAYVRANPSSAQAEFVLAYHYIAQGHADAAAARLKRVVALQPNDTLSAQLLGKLDPSSAPAPPAAPPQPAPFDASKLAGDWTAPGPQNARIALSIKDGGTFTWTIENPGKAPITIAGNSTVADGTLTIVDKTSKMGPLTGQVAWLDDSRFNFKVVGAPATDPGLTFAR